MNKSIGYYCLRYAGIMVLVSVVVMVISYAVYVYAPDVLVRILNGGGGTGAGVASILVSAMLVAKTFYKYEDRRMSRREGWTLAVVFTVLSFVVGIAVTMINFVFVPMSEQEAEVFANMMNDGRTIILTIFAVFFVFLVLINRLILWSSIRGEIKRIERAAMKAGRKAADHG